MRWVGWAAWVWGCAAPAPERDDTAAPPAPTVDTAVTATTPVVPTPTTPPAPVPPLSLCINELMASNTVSWTDDAGARSDWIELHNPGPDPVSLAGWTLSDDPDPRAGHPLDPALTIPAGGHLVFSADDAIGLGALHLPFQLSKDGDTVALYRGDGAGEILHFGPLVEDLAVARSTDCCPDPAVCAALVWVGTPGRSNVPPVVVEEIPLPTGSRWRWRAEAGEPPAGWFEPAFDDSAWPEGPGYLGYGDTHIVTAIPFGPDEAAKWVTYQFRTTFTVQDVASVTALRLDLARDDGVVIWLNGAEVLRSNLPADPLTATTYALSSIGGVGEYSYFGNAVDPAGLVEGENTIAVALHQSAPDSSDVTFDLGVSIERVLPPE